MDAVMSIKRWFRHHNQQAREEAFMAVMSDAQTISIALAATDGKGHPVPVSASQFTQVPVWVCDHPAVALQIAADGLSAVASATDPVEDATITVTVVTPTATATVTGTLTVTPGSPVNFSLVFGAPQG